MSFESSLLENLNPQQCEAVKHHGTPLLIVAGAGSGKTRVITHRIAWLHTVIGIPVWQILAVTFTNKAAREMRQRVAALLGVPDDPSLAISTFHSRCAAILRREAAEAGLESNYAILDDRDQRTAISRAMEDAGVSDKVVKPGQAQSFINLAKMKMLTPQDCEEEFAGDDLPYLPIYKAYEEILRKNNSLDFEDLIFRTVRLFQEKPAVKEKWNRKFRYLLVDEFQDTNLSQFELVKLLAGEDGNVCVVGDEDQSIYSWRGADVKNLLQFKEAFPDAVLIRLEQNYRSVGNVLKAADSVISRNTMRIGKTLWTEREEGHPIRALAGYDDVEEADQVAASIAGLIGSDGIPPTEIAIFYRTHALARVLEDGLRKYRIPYRIVGGTRFYDRAEIKDILCFLRLAITPTNDLAFERVVNVPTRGIGKKTLGDIIECAGRERLSAFEASQKMLAAGDVKGKAKKGLEEFIAMVREWHDAAGTIGVNELLKRVLADTKYKTEGLGDTSSLDGRSRLENIEEFEEAVVAFEQSQADHGVSAFLEVLALDANREEQEGRPTVSLMTVHNAKGLEFDYVFVVGLDHGVFPNSRTFDNPDQYEEERRLFYVALTRAREQLTLSRAMRRRFQGFYDSTTPSQFLTEVDPEVFEPGARRTLGLEGRDAASSRYSDRSRSPQGQPYTTRKFGSTYRGGTPPRSVAPRSGRGSYEIGDMVEHTVLGRGTITQKGGRPGGERVYVEFEDGREQEFVLKFAPLKKITR
ncbi:MAG: ATP-dependent helicase UvrD/PcrA [Candidatus Sumerlaeota bacterium]|nr:ATP-dependent helicase UvrD/PcrA [Candidatus Sumerlaeota bacterium]